MYVYIDFTSAKCTAECRSEAVGVFLATWKFPNLALCCDVNFDFCLKELSPGKSEGVARAYYGYGLTRDIFSTYKKSYLWGGGGWECHP